MPAGVPSSTYRLQLTAETPFGEAARLSRYLRDLGIGAAYCSPVWRARRGSTHGYDVTDPTAFEEDLGGAEGFAAMARAFRKAGLGLVLDVVPNHMAASPENAWWQDVLMHGRASRYAEFFDIDWDGAGREGKVLVPVLGGSYGEELESGALALALDEGALVVAYHDRRLPIDPAFVPRVLEGLDLTGETGEALGAALEAARSIPPRDRTDRRSVLRRARITGRARAHLRDADANGEVSAYLARWSGIPGIPESFDDLDALLDDQAYLPSYWRAALHEIDYRRFFDISDLVSVRNDVGDVFDATHVLVRSLVRRRLVSGLRIDHVDGLRDPETYLTWLRDRVGPSYLVVEKIVAVDEAVPATWPVDGTTGYEFLRDVVGIALDPDGCAALDAAFRERTGLPGFDELVVDSKREVLRRLFDSEVDALAGRLHRLAIGDRYARDATQAGLREAVEEITAALPVYRTYVRSLDGPTEDDRATIAGAVDAAAGRVTLEAGSALAFCRRVFTLDGARRLPPRRAQAWLAAVQRWQQLSGPAAAKGLEDTALYRDAALLARNDVGTEPPLAPIDPATFHARNAARAENLPHTMLATSTHDTKRGEDARMRLSVLSHIPHRWLRAVDAMPAPADAPPDAAERWTLLQLALSVWPTGPDGRPHDGDEELLDRLAEAMRKSMREAKLHTDWLDPDEEYEAAVEGYLRAELRSGTPTWSSLADLLPDVAWHGALAGLSQVLLKVASPGVPDVYRGTELWDLTLVDPDNRRPYDAELRAGLLRELRRHDDPASLFGSWPDGRVKFLLLLRALAARRARPDVFVGGDYLPLEVSGDHSAHVVAFARRADDDVAVAIAPRRTTALTAQGELPVGERWGDTVVRIPAELGGSSNDAITRAAHDLRDEVPLRDVLASFPVALLTSWR